MSTMGLVTTLPSATNTANLNLDFVNQKYSVNTVQKSFTDLINFTRNSSATYVGSDGLIKTAAANTPRMEYDSNMLTPSGILFEEARTNMTNYSSTFMNAVWANIATTLIPNAAIAPDGTLTADKLVEDTNNTNHSTNRSIATVSNSTYTFSVFIKAAERTIARVQFGNFAAQVASNAVWVDLLTGTFTGDPTRTKVQAFPNGWWRISTTVTMTATGVAIVPSIDTAIVMNSVTYAGDGTSGIYIWGAHMELGGFPTNYIPTPASFTSRASIATYYDSKGVLRTAASGVARDSAYGWSAGVLKPIGLLTEAASTNMMLRSAEVDNASWGKSLATVVANGAMAPDGTMSMDLVVPTTALGNHQVSQTFASAASTTYTLSVYFKAGGYNFARLRASDSVGFLLDAVVDLVAGTIYNPSATAKLDSVGNGVYRVSLTATTSVGATSVSLGVWPYDNTRTASFSGDGVSGVYVWGAQLEAGSLVTSYIPTTTAAVTRAADVTSSATGSRAADAAYVVVDSAWFNPTASTIASESRTIIRSGILYPRVYEFSNSQNNDNRFAMLYNQYDIAARIQVVAAGVTVGLMSSGTLSTDAVLKTIATCKQDDFFVSYNGGNIVPDSNGAIPTGMDRMYLGAFRTGGSVLNGCIRNIQVYNRRLPNNLLQVLSS